MIPICKNRLIDKLKPRRVKLKSLTRIRLLKLDGRHYYEVHASTKSFKDGEQPYAAANTHALIR